MFDDDLGSILGRFWSHLGFQDGPKIEEKSIATGTTILIDFLIDLGSILGRFWEPRWLQNRPQRALKMRPKNDKKNVVQKVTQLMRLIPAGVP